MKHFMPNSIFWVSQFSTYWDKNYAMHIYCVDSAINNGLLNKNEDCQTIKMIFQTNWNGDAEDLSLLWCHSYICDLLSFGILCSVEK